MASDVETEPKTEPNQDLIPFIPACIMITDSDTEQSITNPLLDDDPELAALLNVSGDDDDDAKVGSVLTAAVGSVLTGSANVGSVLTAAVGSVLTGSAKVGSVTTGSNWLSTTELSALAGDSDEEAPNKQESPEETKAGEDARANDEKRGRQRRGRKRHRREIN